MNAQGMIGQRVEARHVLLVKLETGDELKIGAGAGADAESARALLASFYRELAAHEFVLLDEDTVVRSNQIAFMQVRPSEPAGTGIVHAVGAPAKGGRAVGTYGSEPGATVRVSGARREERNYGPAPQPLFDPPRQRGSETKPFFLTSEFLVTAGVIAALAIAMATDALSEERCWFLITILAAAYVVSRGIAKAGSRSHADDPRDRMGWGDDR